jgi:hypothetical protein
MATASRTMWLISLVSGYAPVVGVEPVSGPDKP